MASQLTASVVAVAEPQRRSMLMLGPSLLAARQHGAMQREQGEGLLSRLTDYSTRFNL